MEMSPTEPNSTRAPMVSDKQLVLIVYLLYLATYIFGITALIGVIIAHIKLPETGPPSPQPLRLSNPDVLDWTSLSCGGRCSSLRLPGDRSRDTNLVVDLVAGAQCQGRAKRQQADPKSDLLVVWINSKPVKRESEDD